MTVYALHCTLCTRNYSNLLDWNNHLIKNSHQKNVGGELSLWNKSIRKCCVVVYSRMNLRENVVKSVIPYFMKYIVNGVSFIAADLVLSPERSGIGIIRFESRDKVDQLFSFIKSNSIRIDDQLYQFRKLEDFLQLEWEELLVSSFNIELPNLLEAQYENNESLVNPPIITTGSENVTDSQTDSTISCQVKSILKQMEIPEEEFDFAGNLIKEIEKVSKQLLPKVAQLCTAAMFRNNYLKLRNNGLSNKYLIFLYVWDPKGSGFRTISPNFQQKIFQKVASTLNKTVVGYVDSVNASKANEHPKKQKEKGIEFVSKDESLFVPHNLEMEFKLTTFPSTMTSLQLSRLVAYYCQFDCRVKPLLSLVYFWAKVNGIRIGEKKVRERVTFSNEVEPAALEWLMLFFLFHKEGALLPPKEILGRAHQSVYFSQLDVGFNEDLEFAKNWKDKKKNGCTPLEDEESSKNLLVLLKNFFKFCSEDLRASRLIINVRDGEILKSESASKDFVLYGLGGKEIQDKKFGEHLSELDCGYFSNVCKSNSSKMIIMASPFDIRLRLSIDKDNWFNIVQPAMYKTAEKLNAFLLKCDGINAANESLESVLLYV